MQAPPSQLPLVIRPQTDDDFAFIISSWLKSYRDGSPYMRSIANFYAIHQGPIATAIRAEPVWMAVDPSDTTQLFGFWCGDAVNCYFAYVKQFYRKQDVLTRLAGHVGAGRSVGLAFWTHQAATIWDVRYRPNAFWHKYGKAR